MGLRETTKKILLNKMTGLSTRKSTIGRFFYLFIKYLLSTYYQPDRETGTSVSRITLVRVLEVTVDLYLGKSKGQVSVLNLHLLSVDFTLFPSPETFSPRLLKYCAYLVFLLLPDYAFGASFVGSSFCWKLTVGPFFFSIHILILSELL